MPAPLRVEVVLRPFHPDDRIADAEVLKIFRLEEGESILQFLGVEVPETEADASKRVRDHRARHIAVARGELMQLLMREDQSQVIFPSAGQNGGERWRHEVVELI